MSGAPSPDHTGGTLESVLQDDIRLAEVLDPESFREVMTSFADLYRIGIRVYDIDGRKLCDVRVASGPLYAYLFQFGPTRRKITDLVETLKRSPFPLRDGVEMPRLVTCFTGLHYVLVPVLQEGRLLGRLIFGPYLPTTTPDTDESLYALDERIERAEVERLTRAVRRAPNDIVAKVLRQLQKIMDVIVFTSYRSMVTSKLHIESVTSAYNELQEKNTSLGEANERLQELDKMKSNFLATVSHELRTPLTSVIGYSEMLLEGLAGELTDEQHEYVQTIMNKGETLLELISQILDLSRIESGHLRISREEFSIAEALEQAMTSVLPQAQKGQLTLDVQIDNDLPLYLGDRDKIRQIVVNLLGNAVKFTPDGGTITLTADLHSGSRREKPKEEDDFGASELFDLDEEEFVRITVQDTGIGIAKDKLPHVFERFYQVDNTSTREYGGTGLGLSIVKSFVDAHDGEIWVESDSGQGTRFTILLPTNN